MCVFWSQAYNHHLFPATVEQQEENSYYNKADMVEVLLDDGDRRPVELTNVRMLPPNYDIVGKFEHEEVARSARYSIFTLHFSARTGPAGHQKAAGFQRQL